MLNEYFVRAFVADGSGLSRSRVGGGNVDAPVQGVDDGLTPGTPGRGVFATVLRIDSTPEGRAIRADDEDGDATVYAQHRIYRYSVQWYREGAVAAADRFALWAESDPGILAAQGALRDTPPDNEEPLWPAGTRMGVLLPIEVRRFDDTVKDSWEERALVNLRCRYVDTARYPDRAPDEAEVTIAVGGVTVFDGVVARP